MYLSLRASLLPCTTYYVLFTMYHHFICIILACMGLSVGRVFYTQSKAVDFFRDLRLIHYTWYQPLSSKFDADATFQLCKEHTHLYENIIPSQSIYLYKARLIQLLFYAFYKCKRSLYALFAFYYENQNNNHSFLHGLPASFLIPIFICA